MSNATDVRTDGRFVQWEVLFQASERLISSNTFTLLSTSWQLSVQRHYGQTYLILMVAPTTPWFDVDQDYVASIRAKIIHFPRNRPSISSPPSFVKMLLGGSLRWRVGGFNYGRLLIEIKLIDLIIRKTGCPPISLWPSYQMKILSQANAQFGLERMLKEGIMCDITVNAVGGSIRAHRAVLAARSPVFMSMFSHDLKEKRQSTVDITDMSLGACQAFICYFYGSLSEEDFLTHRSELLSAGDKYDVADLKMACEESMLDDTDTENVLERLQMAHLYELSKLKKTCVRLLVAFRKMYEIQEDFSEFLETGDEDLVGEVVQSCLRQVADDKFIYHRDVSSSWFGKPLARFSPRSSCMRNNLALG